jgi:hypothetical protein
LARAGARGWVSYEEDGGRGARVGRADKTTLEFEVEECFELLKFLSGHIVKFALSEFFSFLELNFAIGARSVWWKFVCSVVREDGVSKVSVFRGYRVKPAFFIAGESSDSWVIGSLGGGGASIGGDFSFF